MDENYCDEVQTLIVTMNLDNEVDLLEKMNVRTGFVIGNQTKKDERRYITFRGYKGVVLSRDETGVGKNRNATLFNATGDICILADDDMVFLDEYPEIVKKTFSTIKDADVLIFNLCNNAYDGERKTKKRKRIHIYNYMNYGAARMAFKKSSICYSGISFNILFGGGTPHKCGEDSLFLRECLRKKLKIYAVEESIAAISNERESTWFEGYDEKYFFDKGVFLKIAHPLLAKFYALLLVIRHKEYLTAGRNKISIYNMIREGIVYVRKGYKN